MLIPKRTKYRKQHRPGRSGMSKGGYAAKIGLLALGLYVPRALGIDVRIGAIGTIVAIIVSSSVEMVVMMRKRTMNVDVPNDTE